MKVSVIQPYYSFDGKDNDKCYDEMVRLLDSCDEENGIIVLPEYSDVPSDLIKEEEYFGSINKYNADIMQRAKNTAIR